MAIYICQKRVATHAQDYNTTEKCQISFSHRLSNPLISYEMTMHNGFADKSKIKNHNLKTWSLSSTHYYFRLLSLYDSVKSEVQSDIF